jgi:anthranilate synthase component 2
MILIVDNYDSFTYNLVQLVGLTTEDVCVVRNDRITLDEIGRLKPDGILLSPGPGRPEDAGICVELIRTFGPSVPTLGVCLGHQAIGYAFGGTIIHAPKLMHGKTSPIGHQGTGIFQNLPDPFDATRYHSLVISPDNFPGELSITAVTTGGVIMGVRHKLHPVDGIQFHPESVLTSAGPRIIANWLSSCLEKS